MLTSNRFALGRPSKSCAMYPNTLTPHKWYFRVAVETGTAALAHSLTLVLSFNTGPPQFICAVAPGPIQNPRYLQVAAIANSANSGTSLARRSFSSHKHISHVKQDDSAVQDNSNVVSTRAADPSHRADPGVRLTPSSVGRRSGQR